MAEDDPRAAKVYESIGCYLGHTLAYYYQTYGFRYVLLLGRVMSGKGGDILMETWWPRSEGRVSRDRR